MIKLSDNLSEKERSNEIDRLYNQFIILRDDITWSSTTIINEITIEHPKYGTIITARDKLELIDFIHAIYNIRKVLPNLFIK